MAPDYIFPVWRVFFPLNYKLILNPATSLTNALGNRLISQTQHGSPRALALISHLTRSLCVSINTSALQAWLLGQATWCLSLTHTVFHYLLNPHGSPYAKHFSLSSSWLLPHVLVTTQPAVSPLLLGCQRVTRSQGKSQWWLSPTFPWSIRPPQTHPPPQAQTLHLLYASVRMFLLTSKIQKSQVLIMSTFSRGSFITVSQDSWETISDVFKQHPQAISHSVMLFGLPFS